MKKLNINFYENEYKNSINLDNILQKYYIKQGKMKKYVKTSRKTEMEKTGKALTKQDVIATIQT